MPKWPRLQSGLTHDAPECIAACEGFAVLTARAILGDPWAEVLTPFAFDGPPRVAEIFAGSWRDKSRDQIESSGYVVHSLEAALWSVGNSDSFEEAILLAANLGGDADTGQIGEGSQHDLTLAQVAQSEFANHKRMGENHAGV